MTVGGYTQRLFCLFCKTGFFSEKMREAGESWPMDVHEPDSAGSPSGPMAKMKRNGPREALRI
jgi:hypothetical protein